MKKTFVAIGLCFLLCAPAFCQQNVADQPATQADVEKYMDAVHSREMMSQMIAAMSKPMHNFVHQEYLKNQDKLPADFEARMSKTMDDMLRDFPWDEILKATLPAYQKHFTKGDMEALTAFYSTPTGQKILREMPALLADSMEIMMPILRKHMDVVSGRLQKEMEAMVKDPPKPSKITPVVRN
jgi:uncharacterized protein